MKLFLFISNKDIVASLNPTINLLLSCFKNSQQTGIAISSKYELFFDFVLLSHLNFPLLKAEIYSSIVVVSQNVISPSEQSDIRTFSFG